MYTPLSVLLCVRNGQATLAATVHEFLEVLPEVAECWDLIILDDGSSDATVEVADELSTQYPQIRVVSRSQAFGSGRLIRAGLKASRGAVVLISNGQPVPSPDQLASACKALDRYDVIVDLGNADPRPDPHSDPARSQPNQGLLVLARRRAVEPIVEAVCRSARLGRVIQEAGLRWTSWEFQPRHAETSPQADLQADFPAARMPKAHFVPPVPSPQGLRKATKEALVP